MLPSSPIVLRDGSAVTLRPQTPDDRARLAEFFARLSPSSRYQRFFTGMRNGYDRTLQVVLRHRFITLMVSVLVAVATVALFFVIPKGFIPLEDTGQLRATTVVSQPPRFSTAPESARLSRSQAS